MRGNFFFVCFLFFSCYAYLGHGKEVKDTAFEPDPQGRYLLIADQAKDRIAIVDVELSKVVWQWTAGASNVKAADVQWFKAPSDAKVVYDGKYILLTASLGGVALVRIADKKTVFYAYVGGNTHSAEILPDGNIVTASSTGNYLKIIHTDTTHFPDSVFMREKYLPQAHNVVWDKKRKVLWSAAADKLYKFKYNFNCKHPNLVSIDSILLPDIHPHDLFPVLGKDALWLTTAEGIFKIKLSLNEINRVEAKYTENIKSISSGYTYPTIIMLPKEKWWTDEVLDMSGNVIFKQPGLRMYKARWLLPNLFSYPKNDSFKICF